VAPDRIALVTGAASGLGAAIARTLADERRVVGLDMRPTADNIEFERVDLADTAAAERAVDAAAGRGALDVVVTAAGIDAPGPLDRVTSADWERVVRINLFGTAAVVRAALPHLIENRGRVVTVASTLGLRGVADATAYCASKFGVVGFTRALAAETAGRVGVTLLVPGGMRTAFFDDREEQYRPGADAKLNDADDVARAVQFAVSQPPGCELRELLVAPSLEPSWP
jgi:NAD(P)-dependent dehydrogenase (short-subunit alcohol dehydrogenase family)